jgi:transcriptional regulator
MYIPEHFKVLDEGEIQAFMEEYDFATVVTSAPAGLIATHVPVVIRRDGTGLVIAGHLARANSHWRTMDGSVESLMMFHGPQSYVSPTWYANAPAVPTWNYAVVHAYGKPQFREDRDFLETLLRELVRKYEGGRAEPWRIEDQPSGFHEGMLASIVGFEMPVQKVEAKFKLGQNRRLEDRVGTIDGLERDGSAGARALAEFTRSRIGS